LAHSRRGGESRISVQIRACQCRALTGLPLDSRSRAVNSRTSAAHYQISDMTRHELLPQSVVSEGA